MAKLNQDWLEEERKRQQALMAQRQQKESLRAAMRERAASDTAMQLKRAQQAAEASKREQEAVAKAYSAAVEEVKRNEGTSLAVPQTSERVNRFGMVADYFAQGAKQGATSAAQGVAALGRNFVNDAQKQQTLPFLGMDDTLAAENAKAEAARNAAKAEAAKKAVETAKRQAAELEALNQKYAEKDTLADKALQMTAQGVGGMMPVVAANAIPGLGPVAGTVAAFLQGAGSGYTDALQDGANEGQAMANALLQGAVSGGMEQLVGGVPGFKQAGGLLDNALDGAVNRIGNKALRGAARWGLDAIGEGIEEMGEEALGEAASRFTYGKQGSIEQTLRGEKTLPELAAEYGQTFAGGALVGGVMGAAGNAMRGAMGKNSVPELEKPAQQQSAQQPAAQVPELQQTTQEPVAQEAKPLTVDRTKFTGTKYADAAARTIDSAVAAGMKDSGSARTIVELAAQVAGDTGLQFELKSGEQVKADFIARQTEAIARLEATPDRTDAQTRALEQMREALRKVESGEAIVNGDITGNTVVLNLEAGKPLNRIVGHELTHRLEAVKKQYGSVADAVRNYAAVKGIDYEAELAQRQALYEGVEGADAEGELVADLVGDLLFTDYDFVTHLHAENRNLFQKIWDEVKHLYRMATAGSEEARELERLMHSFQRAYDEAAQQKNTATEGGGKYSLNVNAAGELHKALYDTDYRDDVLLRDESPAIMLAQKGVKNLPMVMKASHIRENVFTEAEAEKLGLRVDAHTHYHGLGEKFYLKVIDGLDNVKLAYRGTKNAEDPSRRENYFLLVSEFKDNNRDTINVPVYIDEHGQVNRVYIDVNKISTVFGRQNFQDYIAQQIRNGNLVRIKNRGIQASERGALIAPDYGMNPSINNNITQTARDVNGQSLPEIVEEAGDQTKLSLSSMANTFFGDPTMSADDFAGRDYHETDGYKNYVDQCVNNYRQSRGADFDEGEARAATEEAIDGIVKVALAAKRAGYDIMDDPAKRDVKDSKKRLLFSSLEPNSEYTTSSDISTICDKRKNFAEIYDAIVRAEEAKGVPVGKRFFSNVDNYFVLHKIMADKGLTQPCRQCYVESMRKNLAPMANAFVKLVTETDPNNKANDQLYHVSGKSKGEQKVNNAKLRERVLEILAEKGMSVDELTVEKLTTAEGLAELKITAPLVYEAFNSFYGQSKPKMPKEATPFRFGELTALLTNEKGEINQSLVKKINSTGGFRLQSYSDFQLQNYVDVLQVLFEAGTLGLRGHAYTKVPAFLEATKGTNLKRNISIFMYKDGDEWKLDKNDSFPMELEEIYQLVRDDESGNTGIIAVSQNDDMSAWIMANDMIGYGIPFHKSGLKMGTVRDTDVKTEDGRTIKGYSGTKDHTKQQTEVWAAAGDGHKALTKVKKGIDIYSFWDFDNADGLSKTELIEKNVKAYIDRCEAAGYLPKFRDYVMKNDKVLANVLKYAKRLGYADADATVDDISFAYKGYRIPYGYYKFLGDFSMFDAEGNASPHEVLSLDGYDFDEAAAFFDDAEGLRRNELLQQIANGPERERYRQSGMTTEQLEQTVGRMRQSVVDDVLNHGGRSTGAVPELDFSAPQIGRRNSLSRGDESVRAGRGWDVYGRDVVDGQAQGVPELRESKPKATLNWTTGLDAYPEEIEEAILDGGNRVIKDYQSVVDVVREAFANVKKKSRAYFGNLSADKLEHLEAQVENLPKELKGTLFKKGKSYSVTATMDSIRHIVEDKGSMTQADVVDYLCKMPQIISNPDRVSFTYYIDSKGQKEKALRFEKAFEDGKMISVEVVSNKKRSLALQSIFMERADYGNKKRAAKTLPSVNGGVTAESGGAGQLFNSNIADGKRSVKPNTVVASKERTGVPELEPTEPAASEPVPELGDLPENAVGATKAKGETYTDSQTNSIRAAAIDAGVTDPDMEADIADHMHVVRGVAEADKAAQTILRKHGTTKTAELLLKHANRAGGWDADDATLAWHTLQAMVKKLNSGSASLDKPKMVNGKDSGMTVREDLTMRMNALSATYADQNTKAGQYLGYLGSKVKELNAANVLRDVQGVVQDAVNRRVENGGGRKKTEQTEKALKIAEQQADEKWLMLVNGKAEHEGGTGRTGKRQTKKVTIWNFDAYREVQAALDELGYKMRDLVTEYSETQRSINGAVINTIVAKNARSEAEARNILEDSVNAFLDLRMDAIQRNLERLFPELRNTNPNESRKSKTAFEKFVDVVNMGQYSRRDIKELVASHYGISPLNNAQTMEIVQLAEQMEKLNRNSKAYAQKKDRVVEILAEALGPTSWSESVSSLSYVMMLSNILKTGGKNVIGNTSSGALYRLKNTVVKPALEKALRATKLGDKLDYTYTTGKVDDALRREAYKVYTDEAYGLVNGPSKYDTTGRLNLEKSGTPKEILEGEVKAARKKYAGKAGKLGDAVQWLADAENETYAAQDELGAIGTAELLNHLPKGSKIAQRISSWAESRAQAGKGGLGGTQNNFVDALARAMKANGIKTAAELDADPERKEELLRYAVQQAKEVTFHDENTLSRKAQVISKDLGWLGRSTMPFARTPANVAMRAVEYSPLGSLIAANKARQGDADAAVDALAKSLTGSALMAIGLAAGALGYLSGGSGDERKDRYEQSTKGEQDYSLNIGKLMQDIGIDAPDATISVETLSPAILPMLIGASLAKDEDGTRNWGDALLSVADPMMDMTFLSGLSDLISDIQSASDPNQALGNIVVSVFTGVLGQYVPSVLRQAGNARNQYRQSYYSDEDTTRKRMADQAVKSATGWIPFLGDDQTIDYVDQWGRKQENAGGSFAGRLAYNMLSPSYYAEGKSTKVDAELEGLYTDLLDAGYTESEADKVYPTPGIYYGDYNVKANGEERRLTKAEMSKFAQVKGQTSYDLVETLTGSSQYKKLDAEAKADLVQKMYSYAKAHGYDESVTGYSMTSANKKVDALYDAYGAQGVVDYYLTKTGANTDGNDSLSNNELIPYLEKQSFSDKEKYALFSQLGSASGKGATAMQTAYGDKGVYDLYASKYHADADGNGSVTTKEAKAYLDKQAFTKAYKAALYEAIVGGDKNPYR